MSVLLCALYTAGRKNMFKQFKKLSFLLPALITGILVFEMIPRTDVVLREFPERLQPIAKAQAKTSDPGIQRQTDISESETDDVPAAEGNFTDGVYTGSARGYGGDITVQVTVENGQITDVTILSAPGETEPYFSLALTIIDKILKNQSWEVDAVSGATYSSKGIKGAVKNALTGETVENDPPPLIIPEGTTRQDTFTEPDSYKDGTYYGTAKGFGGNIKVEVVIKDGRIKSIKIVNASGETGSYLSKAKAVIKRILDKNSPNVDSVSGATYSSTGIINAVKRALKQAAGDGAVAETEEVLQTEESETEPVKQDDFTESDYKDGTYYGEADGFGGLIKVKVVIKKGKIKSIKIISADGETDSFLKKAKSVIKAITESQTPNVDAVSGATYSSTGIINAVKRALNKAVSDKSKASEVDEKETKKENKNKKKKKKKTVQETSEEAESFKDGTYRGTADGFGGPITVEITIKDGKLSSIRIVSAEDETGEYLNKAKAVIKAMLKKGTPDTDAVAGATFSSEGIINAVKKAMKKAVVSAGKGSDDNGDGTEIQDDTGIHETEKETDTKLPETDPSVYPDQTLKDGVYTGTGEGFGGDVTVQVTVTGGRITDITVVSAENETKAYFNKALSIIQNMISTQSYEVDAVSGATYSSMGIIDGVKEALAKAVYDPGSEKETEPGTVETDKTQETGKTDETGENQETGETGDTEETGESTETGSGEGETGPYVDGKFTGNAQCTDNEEFIYDIAATVNVSNGYITSVEFEKINDDSEYPDDNNIYMNLMINGRKRSGVFYPGIPAQIIERQSADVDAISGATYSSNAAKQLISSLLQRR